MSLADQAQQKYGDPEDYADKDFSDAYDTGLDLPIKPGEYLVEVLGDFTDEKETKSGGEMLKVDMQIQAPTAEDRRIFENYVYDCPGNEPFGQEEMQRALHLYQCAGVQGDPTPEALVGQKVIVRTGLEWNDYKEGEFQPTVWDVKPASDGPAAGPHDDEDQPDVWQEAMEFAKNGTRPDGKVSGGSGGGGGQKKTKSFSEDSIPF